MHELLYIYIYILTILQLYAGSHNNFTKSIFGLCSSEALVNNINFENHMLINYIYSLHWKKIAHIGQGLLLGLILLDKIDLTKHFTKKDKKCKKKNTLLIVFSILSFISIISWQLKLIPVIIPLILTSILLHFVIKLCDKYRQNLFVLILSCGYGFYNLGKRSYNKNTFVESSYFSNLFDFFIGLTISIPLILILSDKSNKKSYKNRYKKNKSDRFKILNSIMYLIIVLFLIKTYSVVKLIKYSKNKLKDLTTIEAIQEMCKKK